MWLENEMKNCSDQTACQLPTVWNVSQPIGTNIRVTVLMKNCS